MSTKFHLLSTERVCVAGIIRYVLDVCDAFAEGRHMISVGAIQLHAVLLICEYVMHDGICMNMKLANTCSA